MRVKYKLLLYLKISTTIPLIMLFRKFDFDDKEAVSKFHFNKRKHLSTWKHYSECYDYTIEKILDKGFKRNYAFNCRARGLLFLIRHCLELTLKKNLEIKSIEVPNDHRFKIIFDAFENSNDVPTDFKSLISIIDKDEDGTCFRYYINKATNSPFFDYGETIELIDLFKLYNNISQNGFYHGRICKDINYKSKLLNWDLTFHLGECIGLGHIRTQYDEVIEFIVEGVLYNGYDINKVYLPLMFLIRHSLELALKFNLENAKKMSPEKVPDRDYSNIHSLSTLYNCFGGDNGFIAKLNLESMSEKTKTQFDQYKMKYEELNEVVHQIDNNSRYFRFPIDKKGKKHPLYMKEHTLCKILKLYYLTDPFITFTINVLEEEGIS